MRSIGYKYSEFSSNSSLIYDIKRICKIKKNNVKVTHIELTETADLGLPFLGDWEQGKPTRQLDKVKY